MSTVNENDPLVLFAQKCKEMHVGAYKNGNSDHSDMPPVCIPERNGHVLAMIIAPAVDKQLGIDACIHARTGMAADTFTLLTDAHVTLTSEAAEKHMGKPGSMQHACDADGACAKGEISDCIAILTVTKTGDVRFMSLTYDYHGKDSELRWTKEHWHILSSSNGQLSGLIPKEITAALELPIFADTPTMFDLAKAFGVSDRETILRTTSLSAVKNLESRHYLVVDYFAVQIDIQQMVVSFIDFFKSRK